MFLLEEDNPIGVGASTVVINTPDICGLGEGLAIDNHSYTAETGIYAKWNNIFFKLDLSFSYFANFKSHPATRCRNPVKLDKNPAHRF